MVRPVLFAVALSLGLAQGARADFAEEQRRYPRVRAAYAEKLEILKGRFAAAEVSFPPRGILIRVFKAERTVELWARGAGPQYALMHSYPICAASGELGPKRKQGDLQVPEGFYFIDRFNPRSSYHLSLGLDYPNASDRILGRAPLGGDIFVHGSCASIGCVSIEDDPIEELYVAAVEAKNAGQKRVPVHVFPTRLDDARLAKLARKKKHDPKLRAFWENLSVGYRWFEEKRTLPRVSVESDGQYRFR